MDKLILNAKPLLGFDKDKSSYQSLGINKTSGLIWNEYRL